jgi:hypothetical protein
VHERVEMLPGKGDASGTSAFRLSLRKCRVVRCPGSILQEPQQRTDRGRVEGIESGRILTLSGAQQVNLAEDFKVLPSRTIEARNIRTGAGEHRGRRRQLGAQ